MVGTIFDGLNDDEFCCRCCGGKESLPGDVGVVVLFCSKEDVGGGCGRKPVVSDNVSGGAALVPSISDINVSPFASLIPSALPTFSSPSFFGELGGVLATLKPCFASVFPGNEVAG